MTESQAAAIIELLNTNKQGEAIIELLNQLMIEAQNTNSWLMELARSKR
jgi:hypothetical protein